MQHDIDFPRRYGVQAQNFVVPDDSHHDGSLVGTFSRGNYFKM
jgi:hypothetical protein